VQPLARGEYRVERGHFYGTPKEVYAFRWDAGLRTPRAIAARFCAVHEDPLGLEGLRTPTRLPEAKVLHSLGAVHVIWQQHHLGKRVHRAYVTVHIDRQNVVYLAKNRAVPKVHLPKEFSRKIDAHEALELAGDIMKTDAAHSAKIGVHERLWYPWKDRLLPAIKIRLEIHAPRRRECIVYVDAHNGRARVETQRSPGGRSARAQSPDIASCRVS